MEDGLDHHAFFRGIGSVIQLLALHSGDAPMEPAVTWTFRLWMAAMASTLAKIGREMKKLSGAAGPMTRANGRG